MGKEQDNRQHPFTLEEVVQIAKDAALRDGAHAPTVIVEGSSGRVIGQIEEFPDTHEGRVQRMRSAGFAMAQAGDVGRPKQVFFVSEGWLSIGKEGKPPETQPSQDPNRKEILLITQLILEKKQTKALCLEMIRNASGRLAALKTMSGVDEEGSTMESPLLTALMEGFRLGTRSGIN